MRMRCPQYEILWSLEFSMYLSKWSSELLLKLYCVYKNQNANSSQFSSFLFHVRKTKSSRNQISKSFPEQPRIFCFLLLLKLESLTRLKTLTRDRILLPKPTTFFQNLKKLMLLLSQIILLGPIFIFYTLSGPRTSFVSFYELVW